MQNSNVKMQKLKLIIKGLTVEAAKVIALGLAIAHIDYANALYCKQNYQNRTRVNYNVFRT